MIFVTKKDVPDQSFNVATTIGARTIVKGTVGLEVEVEGNKFPKPPECAGTHHPVKMPGIPTWSYVHDGSLRGEDNAEYILTKPIEFSEVDAALKELWKKLDEYGSVLDDSNRTSVHVHLNVQPFYLNRLTSLLALYYCFEEVLTEWCGEHRVGNLFCLRAKDAPAIISQIRRFIRADMQAPLHEGHHYASLNAHAILKQGSVEFRALRGVKDPEIIKQWVSILQRLYLLSESYSDPRDICGEFSQGGPIPFFEKIMGGQSELVRSGVSMSEDKIRDSMYEGIRLAQDLCYAKDWTLFKAMELKPDPFERDPKKIMKKLASASTADQMEAQLDQLYAEAQQEMPALTIGNGLAQADTFFDDFN